MLHLFRKYIELSHVLRALREVFPMVCGWEEKDLLKGQQRCSGRSKPGLDTPRKGSAPGKDCLHPQRNGRTYILLSSISPCASQMAAQGKEMKFSYKHLILGAEALKENCWVSRPGSRRQDTLRHWDSPRNGAAGTGEACGGLWPWGTWQSDAHPLFDNILKEKVRKIPGKWNGIYQGSKKQPDAFMKINRQIKTFE